MKKLASLFIMIFSILLSCTATAESQRFLVISDIHLDNSTLHKMDITPSAPSPANDLDVSTFNQLMTSLSEYTKTQTPAFIIVLGDLVGHNRLTADPAQSEATVFRTLKNSFPNTPVFYVFGNNDALKNNYGAFNDASLKSPYDIALTNGWKNGFLSTGNYCEQQAYPCILNENKKHGYYSAKLNDKLQLIAINSVMFSEKHKDTTAEDASNQLAWLATQLKAAKENHVTVLLAMHIPPGTNVYNHTPFWQTEQHAAFVALLDTYHDIIIGALAGHTHAEELKIIKLPNHELPIGVFLTSALATIHGNQSSVKMFELAYDQTWQLSNYQTFYFSVIDNELRLTKLYDFNRYYCAQASDPFAVCLAGVTAEKMQVYFSAGNPFYAGVMSTPVDIFL